MRRTRVIHIDAYRLEKPEQIYQVLSKEELADKNNFIIGKISNVYKQQLTHQTIQARFIHVELTSALPLTKYELIAIEHIKNLPFPKIVTAYFEDLNAAVGAAWNRFWFTASSASTLGMIRIAAGLLAFYAVATYYSDLELWFGDDNYGGTSTVDSCGEILNGRNHPELTSLGLKNSAFDEELIEALVHSTVLPRLQSLDLSMGTLAKGAAGLLVKHAKHFAHLQKLDLDDNFFSAEDIAAIAKVLPKAEFGNQRESDGDDGEYRYPSVTE